ncbi:hypothetical protein DFJ73DRAFT_931797 [Zopfochytrium polystomum]|nr:hypothetical protein DFJ73DRAFT_931797 [Zopfochytrium polystomum]
MPVPVPVPVPAGSNEVPVLGDEGVAMLEEKPRKPQRNHPNGVLNPPRKLTRSESSPALQNTAIDQSYRYNELTGHKNDRDSKRERNARLIKGTVKVINYGRMGDRADRLADKAAAKFRSLTGKKKHDPKPDGMLAAVAKGAAKNGAGAAASSAMSGFVTAPVTVPLAVGTGAVQAAVDHVMDKKRKLKPQMKPDFKRSNSLPARPNANKKKGPPPNVPGKMPVGRLKSAAKSVGNALKLKGKGKKGK